MPAMRLPAERISVFCFLGRWALSRELRRSSVWTTRRRRCRVLLLAQEPSFLSCQGHAPFSLFWPVPACLLRYMLWKKPALKSRCEGSSG